MSTRIGIHALLRAGAFCAAAALTSAGLAAEADTSEVPRPSAEALSPSPPTAPRFRGAVGLAAGALLAPESSSLLTIGVEGQLGIQYNDRLGLVVIPSLGAGLLDTLGLFAGLGLLADYTLDDSLSVGIGPECVGLLASFEDRTSILGYRFDVGGLRGGRARLTWTPLLARTANGTRKAMALAFDLRVLGGMPTGQFDANNHGVGATYAIWSNLSISYQVF